MNECVHAYMYVCMCICYVCVEVWISICIHICVCMYVCIYVCGCICMLPHVYNINMCMNVHKDGMYVSMYIWM